MAAGYVEMLQGVSLMTADHHLFGNDWVFQQENTAVHNAPMTKYFFREITSLFGTLLHDPPDLNPIKCIWGWMAGEVYKSGHQLQSVDVLHEASIFTTWNNISSSLLETQAC